MDKKNILIVIIVFLLSCLLLVIGSNPNTLSAKILGLESKVESPRQLYNVYLAGKSIGIIESKEALENNMNKDNVHHFATKEEAMENFKNILQKGDTILVKASRGMHLEEVVEFLNK